MRSNKDMSLFNKLSEKQQLNNIEKYIASLPKEDQEEARTFILG